MSQYFDKDFLKFLVGFVSILIIVIVFTAFLREYESKTKIKLNTPKVYMATPQP